MLNSTTLNRVSKAQSITAKVGIEKAYDTRSIRMLMHQLDGSVETLSSIMIFEGNHDHVRKDMEKHAKACKEILKVALFQAYLLEGFLPEHAWWNSQQA